MSKLSNIAKEQRSKMILYVAIDGICINFSVLLSIFLWYGGSIPGLPRDIEGTVALVPDQVWMWFGHSILFLTAACLIVYNLLRFYSNIWKYATIDDIYKIIIADTIIFVALYGYHGFLVRQNIIEYPLPKRMLLVAWIIDIVLFIFTRSGYRVLKKLAINIENLFNKKSGLKRVLIVGAGYSGYNVVRSILTKEKGYEKRIPIIVVDDDYNKNNNNLSGVRVTHDIANIPRIADEYEINEIIIAIPSATNVQMKRIMDFCTQTECTLKMMPPMSDISNGGYKTLRDVDITDLLFRDEVEIDIDSISQNLMNKVVLVTGGGGSIGSELCRQIAKYFPKKLIIFDVYENNAYALYEELKDKYNDKLDIIIRIGTIRDINSIEAVFKDYGPNVVFHAAAHKHVPLMEAVPSEAVKNNVFGTLNVAICADKYLCDKFILLSTDKAVNPSSIMGATKRITELIVQDFSSKSKTLFVAVRFGNVLGSNGSVIPLFQAQIKAGGPVTVTDKNMIRFFMTIPEAAKLVLQAACIGENGKIYVLDMGEPVKIDQLARSLIKLSGYVPDKDIEVVYTGVRAGEKLYEELILEEEKEQMQVVYGKKIFATRPVNIDSEVFNSQLIRLREAANNNPDMIRGIIKEIVSNYQSKGE